MQIRPALLTDVAAMTRLWAEAFGEGDVYCTSFFETHFCPEQSLVALEEGVLCGMLHTVAKRLNGVPARYLYAVATKKEYRGRGVFTALHDTLLSSFAEDLFLIPEGEHLRAFYERFSYRTVAYRPRLKERAARELSLGDAWNLYRTGSECLPLQLSKEEFFTTLQDKTPLQTEDGRNFFLRLADGTLTSFFDVEGEEREPTAMLLSRSGKAQTEFVLPCFLN